MLSLREYTCRWKWRGAGIRTANLDFSVAVVPFRWPHLNSCNDFEAFVLEDDMPRGMSSVVPFCASYFYSVIFSSLLSKHFRWSVHEA